MNAGELPRVDLDAAGWDREAEFVNRYSDLNLGLVDASVVAIAERLRIVTLATPTTATSLSCASGPCDAFELIP